MPRGFFLIAAIAVALVAGGSFAVVRACDARRAAELQAQEAKDAAKREPTPVNPTKLGITAAPFSTPKSTWKQGKMPHLYQTDPQWAYLPYATGTISKNGCGPTALSMVYVYLTGKTDLGPVQMCAFADAGNYAPTGSTEWEFMTEGAQSLGLGSEAIPVTRSSIMQALGAGQPVICVVNPGDFTNIGHFIVLKSIDDRGMVEVFDPNSPVTSAKRWGIQRIINQTSNCWTFWV